jgi:hypothetical protein
MTARSDFLPPAAALLPRGRRYARRVLLLDEGTLTDEELAAAKASILQPTGR